MLAGDRRRGRWDWASLPWHVIGIGAFPVLFLFAENAPEELTLGPLWLPLAEAVAGAALLVVVCAAILRDWRRGGLIASLLLAGFFSFGHVWNLIAEWVAQPPYLLAAYEVPLLAGGVLAWRGGRWVRPGNLYLNLAALLLVLFNGYRVAEFAIFARAAPTVTGTVPELAVGPRGTPDIYYIILDRYAGEPTLDQIYGYDNTPFIEALEDRGFVVAHDAWANYFKTAPSVVCSLSMEYLDRERYDTGDPDSFTPIHQALRNRLAAPAALKRIGYQYVHIGNYWEPTKTNVDADVIYNYTEGTAFQASLAATSGLMLLHPVVAGDEDPETIEFPELARNHTLYGFNRLEAQRDREGATFVFAHILVPHPPYVFNADGSMPTAEQAAARHTREKYVEQLKWANQRVLAAIDHLLDVPADEQPIIILQADEGPWPARFEADQHDFQWLTATPEEIQQKFGILNAYHLPGYDRADLEELGFYDRISPVNVYRIVFNAFFGTELPLLPDETWLSPDYDTMYDFVLYPRD